MQVLITGANRGIGAALASAYRTAGNDVLGTARDGSSDLTLDVADPDAFAPFGASADAALGQKGLDLLICNAGVYQDKGHNLDGGFPASMWAESLAINVTGVFLTIQTLLPALQRAGTAKIAIISSNMASQELAPGGSYIYRASKAAVLNLGRNLAKDLKSEGISVGIYHPGWVQTDMGGPSASISAGVAASGLLERIGALGPATTGCYEAWDGSPIPF